MLQVPASQVAEATLAAAVQLLPHVPQLLGSVSRLALLVCIHHRYSNNSNMPFFSH
jgi:hypothetical protein